MESNSVTHYVNPTNFFLTKLKKIANYKYKYRRLKLKARLHTEKVRKTLPEPFQFSIRAVGAATKAKQKWRVTETISKHHIHL